MSTPEEQDWLRLILAKETDYFLPNTVFLYCWSGFVGSCRSSRNSGWRDAAVVE